MTATASQLDEDWERTSEFSACLLIEEEVPEFPAYLPLVIK